MGEQGKVIIVGMDFSEPAIRALELGIHYAQKLEAPIHVVHAYDIPRLPTGNTAEVEKSFTTWLAKNSKEQLDALLDKYKSNDVALFGDMVAGDPATKICETARKYEAQLIIVGTKGHNVAYRALLGSVADRVIRTSQRPVLMVH
ncbi:MAG: universal stress protein [Myxococcales bacterium]|nr:MAG: universal stress protein [Myxococcales bacterium]